MRKNVGTLDASIRIAAGLVGLAYGIGRMARRPHRTPWLIMSLSAMKVAEGITRFCPTLYALGLSTRTRSRSRRQPGQAEAIERLIADAQQEQPVKAATAPSQEAEEAVRSHVEGVDRTSDETGGIGRPRRARKLPKRPSAEYSQEEHYHPTYS